ncbi:Dual-specificity kinase, spindle pole body (SPB) duplication and spindle checkpoint function [Kappamyces sp. JEL0680]|nr:Dual-specificity kinase, spindle pole body (SPB) duplication and spindle checkpoint function [Kappamyces sp. JEL0680]
MDLSQTITFIQQTPRAANPEPAKRAPVSSVLTAVEAKKDEAAELADKNLVVGGSCKVFKIVDGAGHIFALKKVKLRGQDASVVEGYKNEIILLNKLKTNDRIIRLYDAEHDAKQQILLMVLEYGEIDLERMLQKDTEQPLSINFIRNYWEQMLQAVQAIHDQNIIHSDLKPANFLLVGGCLKLIDFGIAKAIPNDTTNIQRDHQSGTVNYMAPEAINYVEISGAKQNYLKQGRASDVWSLACILYRFIYLHPPFGKLALMAKIHAITNAKHSIPYPPTQYPEVVAVLKACLVYEPKKRLTIPELLAHPFLKAGHRLTPEIVSQILTRAIELGLSPSNVAGIAEVSQSE